MFVREIKLGIVHDFQKKEEKQIGLGVVSPAYHVILSAKLLY